MANYLKSEKTFVNPYHFISLEKGCKREPAKDEKKLTGWLDCRLETLSPVFIPNTSSVVDKAERKVSDVFGKRAIKDGKEVIVNSYDFFSYTDLSGFTGKRYPEPREPVIPGSEIRGMIRSAFEAVTNSCLSTLDDEQPLYKRVQSPAKPGRLVYDKAKKEWHLYQCTRYRLPKKFIEITNTHEIVINGETYREGETVYVLINYKNFKVIKISKKQTSDRFKQGFLHIGEYNENKNYESVFVHRQDKKTRQDEVITLPDHLVPGILNNLVENVLLYRDKANKTEGHTQYRHLDKSFGEIKSISSLVNRSKKEKITPDKFNVILENDYKPVFDYLKNALINSVRYGNNYYISPAMIGRQVFYKKLTDILKAYKPCHCPDIDQRDQLCPACALFGLAGKYAAAASRVRFTDAHVSGKKKNPGDYYDEIRILKELASPKLSATEFYLQKNPDYADLWNYDYSINWNSHRYGIPGYKAKIRGRKFYWHHKNPEPYVEKEKENDPDYVSDRNVAVRPLKKGNAFEFKIYFNNITGPELKKLLWVLEIGSKKETHGHKIGMGKPIGMGSIRIFIANIHSRKIKVDKENGTIHYDEHDPKDRPDDYKNILNWSDMNHRDLGCSEEVLNEFLHITRVNHNYHPIEYPNIEDELENYLWFMANKQIKGTGTRPIIEQTLPPIDNPWLKKYKEKNQ